MKKTTSILALAGVSSLALAGCMNLEEQIAGKFAESIINQATGGEVQVDLGGMKDGKINIKTAEGDIVLSGDNNSGSGTMTITDKDGVELATAHGNETRPSSAPADMPSLPGFSFSYLNLGQGNISLSYKVNSPSFIESCQAQERLILASGWQVHKDGISAESSETIMKTYQNSENTLTVNCTKLEDNEVMIAIVKGSFN